jgi:hypothetical protein
MCSAEPAIPLEHPASSKEAVAEARQMENKRQKAAHNKHRRAKVKAAGGQDAYQKRRALAAAEALSKRPRRKLPSRWKRSARKPPTTSSPTLSLSA